LVQDALLTGDTLFIRDCGRTDLPTGSTTEMFSTLQRYKSLNPQLKIFPGHHYREEFWSTLEVVLRTSPPLQCESAEQLEALP
jgi:glyoxylase-like metal-dependent hydrolase (beta-lactamase superfamily II)